MDEPAIHRLIGRRIRLRRRRLEMTQRALAQRCGLTFQVIHKHEAGLCVMTVPRLIRIAQALDVPLDHLLAGCADPMVPRAEDAQACEAAADL